MATTPIDPLEFTGERMVPEATEAQTLWEHLYRYQFAARHVRGKRVLDIACGEGYGSAGLLRAGASSVVGVDIDERVVEHARRKYNVDVRVGSADRVPVGDTSVDVVVSFETIEHVEQPARFVDECARVLVPGGLLFMSTPNRKVYRAEPEAVPNPFHCSEMDKDEFLAVLAPRFAGALLFAQCHPFVPRFSSRVLSAGSTPWERLRGFDRLRRVLRSRLLPPLDSVSDRVRDDPAGVIAGPGSALATAVNPYGLRRWRASDDWLATYLLAVARRT